MKLSESPTYHHPQIQIQSLINQKLLACDAANGMPNHFFLAEFILKPTDARTRHRLQQPLLGPQRNRPEKSLGRIKPKRLPPPLRHLPPSRHGPIISPSRTSSNIPPVANLPRQRESLASSHPCTDHASPHHRSSKRLKKHHSKHGSVVVQYLLQRRSESFGRVTYCIFRVEGGAVVKVPNRSSAGISKCRIFKNE